MQVDVFRQGEPPPNIEFLRCVARCACGMLCRNGCSGLHPPNKDVVRFARLLLCNKSECAPRLNFSARLQRHCRHHSGEADARFFGRRSTASSRCDSAAWPRQHRPALHVLVNSGKRRISVFDILVCHGKIMGVLQKGPAHRCDFCSRAHASADHPEQLPATTRRQAAPWQNPLPCLRPVLCRCAAQHSYAKIYAEATLLRIAPAHQPARQEPFLFSK